MNRRSALWLTMLMGGLAPFRALGQQVSPRKAGSPKAGRIRAVSDDTDQLDEPRKKVKRGDPVDEDLDADTAEEPATEDQPPADFGTDGGRHWRTFDIKRYTALPHKATAPQSAIVDWVFRRTEVGPWHDDKIAALSASRARVAAYHSEKVLKQVQEVVERFTEAEFDILSLRVQMVAAGDSRWRYLQFARLNLIGTGPQGQRLWTVPHDVATQLVTRMQDTPGFLNLADQTIQLINGQTLTFERFTSQTYNGSLQRDSGAALGAQPKAEAIREGIELKISPLLTYDGDAVDAAIELTANTVRRLHSTRVLAARDVGPNEAAVEVPEVCGTRLSQTVKAWPLNQTLMISAGILPGILHPNKNGFMNLRLPGTVPSTTELLLFLRAEPMERTRPRRD
ncbi:hypothetical protein EP7_000810 [Isosphaeraceae bacterium EP7]